MTESRSKNSRRAFLQTGVAAAALAHVPFVHAQGGDTLKVGLIGCGGRGTGAAGQALKADRNVKLVAMGDAFADRLQESLAGLKRDMSIASKIDVPAERQFVGFDAYQKVIDSGIDVVLLCTSPHFRPQHLEYAVKAKKHIFAEKPVAVDGTGVRRVLAACEEAKKDRLSIVSGLCWRYHNAMRETVKRIHDGAIGDIHTLQCNYLTGALWNRPRQPAWNDMEYQMRNWPYFTWLSGDFNVEQHVHSLDKMAWIMKNEYPVKCVGLGGRQSRTGPDFGHIFDHMSVIYEFANGARCFAHCRQQLGCSNDVSDHAWGSKGKGTLLGANRASAWRITGPNEFAASNEDRNDNMYQHEHDELFKSIRDGKPINDGDWMTKSTLMGVMGRVACYTGREITWEKALNSTENLTPAKYEWGPLVVPATARPGYTQID